MSYVRVVSSLQWFIFVKRLMSVISSKLMGGACTLEIDEKLRRVITERYLVETNNKNDRVITVLNQSMSFGPDPVPAYNSQYNLDGGVVGTSDPTSVLLKKKITRVVTDETDRLKWYVDCTWMTPPEDTSQFAPVSLNPLLEPVRYAYEWASFTRQPDTYGTGLPLINAAGDAFDPPLEIDDARPVMVATRNMWPFDDIVSLSRNYKDAVNSDFFHGQAPGTAKVESITLGSLSERNGIQYYPVTFRIQFTGMDGTGTGTSGTNATWTVTRVSRGAQVLEDVTVGTATVKRKVWPKVKTGTAKGEFLDYVNLNVDGTQRDDTLPPLTKTFDVYPQKPFADLGI